MTTSCPLETSRLNPRPRSLNASAENADPLWDRNVTGPCRITSGVRNPVARTFDAWFMKPMPLPPHIAIPFARAIARSRTRRSGPSDGSSYSDENVTALPASDAAASVKRLFDPLVRDPEDREVDGLRHLGDRRVATQAGDLFVAGVHRVDRAVEPASFELGHHRLAERACLDRRAHDRDRARLQHPADRRQCCVGLGHAYFFPRAWSFFAILKACQPGMPFTPPPACVALDP